MRRRSSQADRALMSRRFLPARYVHPVRYRNLELNDLVCHIQVKKGEGKVGLRVLATAKADKVTEVEKFFKVHRILFSLQPNASS